MDFPGIAQPTRHSRQPGEPELPRNRRRRIAILTQLIFMLICLSIWETCILAKLEGRITASWAVVFVPGVLGYVSSVVVRGAFMTSSLWRAFFGAADVRSLSFNTQVLEDMLETASAFAHLLALGEIGVRLDLGAIESIRHMLIPFFIGLLVSILIGYYGTARMATLAPHVPREKRKLGWHKLLIEYINASLVAQKLDQTLQWPWGVVFMFQWLQALCFGVANCLLLAAIVKAARTWWASPATPQLRYHLAALLATEVALAGVLSCTTTFYVRLAQRCAPPANLRRDWAHRCHICAGTWLALAHPHRDSAQA